MTDEPVVLKVVEAETESKHKKPKKKADFNTSSGSPFLELYQVESDPFSHTVRNRLSELALDFIAHNVSKHDALKHERLVQAGGKDQYPFLVDHRTGTKLYESSAIIAYLNAQYGKEKEGPARTPLLRFARQLNERLKNGAEELTWAVRNPLERARHLGGEVKETWNVFGQSLKTVRQVFTSELKKDEEEKSA